MERLKKELDLIHVAYSEKTFKSSTKGVESLGDNPFVRSKECILIIMLQS